MVEQRPTNIQEIFRDSILQVPEYQRDYSWERQHVKDLLRDISYLFTEEQRRGEIERHYFGTIVLHQVDRVEMGSDEFQVYNVVDGQQRLTTISIIIGSFIEQIENLEIDLENLNQEERRPGRLITELREDYIEDRGRRRLELHTGNQEIFNTLIENETELGGIETDRISERRLVGAKEEVLKWLEEFDTGSDLEFYRTILSLKRLINNYFEVTQYKVENVGEAGRIFETLNDRGRTLTIADKIKSYLVYCANRIDDQNLVDRIYEDFGELFRNITSDGTEAELRRFMREHWRMFSGEIEFRTGKYEINDLHRRIKDVDDHATLQRDRDELVDWIEAYLDSLVEASESYNLVARPKNINTSSYDGPTDDIKRNLENIHRNTSSKNVASLLIASHLEFGFSSEFEEITSLLEKYAWRSYQVCRAHRDYGRRIFRRLAYMTYYQGDMGGPTDIFQTLSEGDRPVFTDLEEAYMGICHRIEDLIGNYGPELAFENNIRRQDVFSGTLNTDTWNGFRDSEKIAYFLYEYEYYLRQSSSPPIQTESLGEWEQRGLDIEYLWPNEKDHIPPELESEHTKWKDSFGNLALRHPEQMGEDLPSGVRPYPEKFEEVYSDSPLQMMTDLPSAEWGPEDIKERLDQLVEFALERWGIETRAIVPLDVDKQLQQDITSHVIDRFDKNDDRLPSNLNNLPAVDFDPDYSIRDQDILYTCPSCDGLEFTVNEDQPVLYSCDCNTDIEFPNFIIHLSDYSIDD